MNGNPDITVRTVEEPRLRCLDCAAYEPRTGFCRCEPPRDDGNGARFPKIQMPFLDYCLKFKKKA